MIKNIVLIGYMGCGKSTLGREIAKRLDARFIDLDEWIESHHCKTISEIFKDSGEEYFRKIENEALNEVLSLKGCVIATGGGAPCFFDNMDQINKKGISIYINTSVDVLTERLLKQNSQRPLLAGKNREEIFHYIFKNLAIRSKWYESSQYTILADNNTSAENVISLFGE